MQPPGTASVVTYAAPSGYTPVSTQYEVIVNGSPAPVYTTPDMGHFASFDSNFSSSVPVTVNTTFDVTSVSVSPQSDSVVASNSARSISFNVPTTGQYVVFVNGVTATPLFIFANPLEVNPPKAGDVGVTYYGPGYYDLDSEIVVGAGKTLYVHGGAVIRGKVRVGASSPSTAGIDGAKVMGRGIVDSSIMTDYGRPMRIQKSSNVSVSGLTFLGKEHWGVVGYMNTGGITIDNIKVLNWQATTSGTPDGIDMVGTQGATISNSFVRAYDDGVTIKCSKNGWSGSSADITYSNMVIYQGDGGNATEIGYENDTGFRIDRSTFRDIDVVRKTAKTPTHKRSALGIHLTGDSPVDTVLYDGYRVEYSEENLIYISSFYTTDYPFVTRAPLTNVTIRNFSGPGGLPSVINSDDAGKPITVNFENARIGGVAVTSAASAGITTTNASAAMS